MEDNIKHIDIPTIPYYLSSLVKKTEHLWVRLGKLETYFYQEDLESIRIEKPIFICGLARSGTTILLELLSTHSDVATHQYRDFPLLYTPIWWNHFLDRIPHHSQVSSERAHKDGILVNPNSPEAMEEVLWMKFFKHSHNPYVSNVLTAETDYSLFEKFYQDHLRKILFVRNGKRFLSKGNYNLSRLEYLLKLFPDARFVIPVRDPRTHIASLVKQHRLFCREESRDRRILEYMRRVGHFEFGLDRRAIKFDASEKICDILALWQMGEEIRGWARYWNTLYSWVIKTLNDNHLLKSASLLIRYEDLCSQSHESFLEVCKHCYLEFNSKQFEQLTCQLKFPSYYKVTFTVEELKIIDEETHDLCQTLGY